MKQKKIRFANEGDTALILGFIRELAEYENMADQVVADENLLREWIFEKRKQRYFLLWRMKRKWDSLSFFTISPRFSAELGSIWKIFTFNPPTEATVTARR